MDQKHLEETHRMLPVSKNGQQKIVITDTKKNPGSWYGVRYTQVMLLFAMMVIGYGMRINLSVAIVAMTDPTINPVIPTYDWSISVKSQILSAFFFGYSVPQLFAGRLAEVYGLKWFLTGAMAISSMLSVLIPILATISPWAVMACRVIQGISQAIFLPAIHFVLSKWSPFNERSRMASFIFAGGPLGTVICMPVTGWISASTIGWPSTFYLFGISGFVWTALWIWLAADSPAEHKTISEWEKNYIHETTGATDSNTKKKYPMPFKHIATSLPFWGIIAASCGQSWGYWTLLTQIPTYMNGVLNFDIKQNGLLSAAPYFALWVVSFFFSAIADFIINKKILPVNAARKLLSAVALIGPAITLFVLGILGKPDREVAVALLILAVAINAAVFSGHQVNHIDIAPTHAATLMGITNGIATLFSINAPLIVQYVVTDETDPHQWKIVFFIAAAIYIVTDLFYTTFGKASVQYWDKLEENEAKVCSL